ncbi:MAG: amidase family protein, partial [Anaerolineae bacterium]|nr:amidase family protein [Anaerolineae bacterium]
MSELTEHTLGQALAGLEKGDFSSRELTQAYLDRIEKLDPEVHAFLHVAPEAALKQAEAMDSRRKDGGDLPALLGIPLAIKDVLAVADLPATCGSRILDGFVPPYTATAVGRLLDAGALIL